MEGALQTTATSGSRACHDEALLAREIKSNARLRGTLAHRDLSRLISCPRVCSQTFVMPIACAHVHEPNDAFVIQQLLQRKLA